jgi:hypothetical protein
MIPCRLPTLPAFVRMLVTSRPQDKEVFKSIEDRCEIEPTQENNKDDVLNVISAKLKSFKREEAEKQKAEAVVFEKSKVMK